jgi:hypothetical protein
MYNTLKQDFEECKCHYVAFFGSFSSLSFVASNKKEKLASIVCCRRECAFTYSLTIEKSFFEREEYKREILFCIFFLYLSEPQSGFTFIVIGSCSEATASNLLFIGGHFSQCQKDHGELLSVYFTVLVVIDTLKNRFLKIFQIFSVIILVGIVSDT